MEFVRIGNILDTDRQGSVYLTADDSGAPYIDIIDGITSHDDFNTQGTIKARLGDLDGVIDQTVGLNQDSVYGLYADSAYLKGNLVLGGVNPISLSNSTIALGNVTGTANNAVKIANTGTASSSGLFGYNASGNEVFALKLNNSASVAGFDFDINRIFNSAVEINSTDSHIFLKSGASMSTAGLFLSGSGEMNLQDDNGNYLRMSGGQLSANVDTVSLSGSSVSINTPEFYLGDATNYLSGSNGNIAIVTDNATLSGSSISITAPTFFMGSGDNYLSGSGGEMKIRTDNIRIDAGSDYWHSDTKSGSVGGGILN